MSDDTSIFHEIDEALRVERLQQFWQRSGKLVIAGCIGVIALTAASVLWKEHLVKVHMQQTGFLLQARDLAESGNDKDVAALFGQAGDGAHGLAVLAKLWQANAWIKANQKDKALALYTEIAAESRNKDDIALHDFAVLQASILSGNQHTAFDAGHASETGRPFTNLIAETEAARLMKEGKNKEAVLLLKPIADNANLPVAERGYAMELLDAVGGDAK